MPIEGRTVEIVIGVLATAVERAQHEKRRLENEADDLRSEVLAQRAMRREDADIASKRLAEARKQRDDALAKLAKNKKGRVGW